jgi:HAD superfamily hydrolase (TIGR01490 family)
MEMKKIVYAFDFDGTLTTKDTLLEFIRFACGGKRLFWGLVLFSPLLVLMKLKLYPNWKAKQQFFSYFFKGMEIDHFDALCQRFATECADLMRPNGKAVIKKALAEGASVIIVSASIDNWVRPFFADYGDKVVVACTRIDVRHDHVTGKFLTKNCYGREKVKRIDRAFPHRSTYELIAFGDSMGDKQMMDYADKSYYKPFRTVSVSYV